MLLASRLGKMRIFARPCTLLPGAFRLLMLEHSVYTVAAPEAAASILWRDNTFAPQPAEAMRISPREALATQIIDGLIPEPVGGAHRNPVLTASHLQTALKKHLWTSLSTLPKS